MSEDETHGAIRNTCREIAENFTRLAALAPQIAQAASCLGEALRKGGKVLFCGNGGSAADSQHLAAELLGRFLRERDPLAALALSVDTSSLTAIANDYSFEQVFARQLRGLARPGDALVAISTSGQSPNVLAAARAARELEVAVVGLTGPRGGALAELADVWVGVPAERTDHVQELHIAVGHMLCDIVEKEYERA